MESHSKSKSIIISRTDKIGDLVLSIPSFFMLRKMYPKAKITILVRNYNFDIVKNLPYIDEVIKIDEYSKPQLVKKIKAIQADIFIALYANSFIGKLAKKSGAKYRVGPYSKFFSFFSFNKGVRQKRSESKQNEAEYNLDLVRSLNPEKYNELLDINSTIYLSNDNKDFANDFIKSNNIKKPFIMIHPFMGGSAKNITDEQYIDLIWTLSQKLPNSDILVSASIADENRCLEIVRACQANNVKAFINQGPLLNLAGVINECQVFFGGSTGPTHIAGGLGKNIVALYPSLPTQSPKRWGVYNNRNVKYVLPDKEKLEDYTHKYFDSYSEIHKQEIISAIYSYI